MNEPRVPSEKSSTPGVDGQSPLNDAELDKLSDDMLDQVSGGVTTESGPS